MFFRYIGIHYTIHVNKLLKMYCLLGAELCDYIRLCLLHSAGIRPDLELLADPAHQAPIITR